MKRNITSINYTKYCEVCFINGSESKVFQFTLFLYRLWNVYIELLFLQLMTVPTFSLVRENTRIFRINLIIYLERGRIPSLPIYNQYYDPLSLSMSFVLLRSDFCIRILLAIQHWTTHASFYLHTISILHISRESFAVVLFLAATMIGTTMQLS